MLDHFDIIASFYDRLIGPPDTSRLRRLLKLPAVGWLLDAGGGTGRVSNHFSTLVSGLVVSDLSHHMLAKARAKDIRPVQAHTEKLPFVDEFFDRVLVVDALHHFCSQHESISDLLRVLKPGGRLVIEEPDCTHKGVKVLALIEKMLLMRSHFHSPEKIQRMIVSNGVSAHIERDHRYTAWIIADKV
ncbi:MAG: class I SAM-dependent methyltransferase [Deltaproteobacteria bacterium]|jgi:demethylmenaquinone methyltransferase/2-methoxy-6-polyprenyl-1,4-benzoquinol methylase|nr:class I SAM-dependent methyltransferase [Deltaproteobacteria bacterium]